MKVVLVLLSTSFKRTFYPVKHATHRHIKAILDGLFFFLLSLYFSFIHCFSRSLSLFSLSVAKQSPNERNRTYRNPLIRNYMCVYLVQFARLLLLFLLLLLSYHSVLCIMCSAVRCMLCVYRLNEVDRFKCMLADFVVFVLNIHFLHVECTCNFIKTHNCIASTANNDSNNIQKMSVLCFFFFR